MGRRSFSGSRGAPAAASAVLSALVYLLAGLVVIANNLPAIPHALGLILTGAFTPEGGQGGMLGVISLGFRITALPAASAGMQSPNELVSG